MASNDIYAGVDIGGTKVAVALGTAAGHLVASGSVAIATEGEPMDPSDGSPTRVLERTARLIESLADQCGAKPAAIGVGLPGLVNVSTGTAEFLPNLPEKWKGIQVAKILGERTGKNVYILNDARLATLGEFTFGAGRTTANMLLVTVGTGIGGGLILDGRLRLGLHGGAGEVGHQTIIPDGLACACGSRGCLETLASGPALAAEGTALLQQDLAPRLRELAADSAVTPKLMVAAAAAGDTLVAAAIDRAARYLGIGIANAVTITAVELVVITGGMSALGELLLKPVRDVIRDRVRMFPGEEVRVSCSVLGDQAGVFGGIALAAQRGLPQNEQSPTRGATAPAPSGNP
ncbi:MAG: ROK family protein [Bryobacteraceae bacterium]